MQNKIRCAVIGVGNMGKNHTRIYSEITNVTLAAISDTNEHLGISIAKQYNIRFYKDFKEMIAKEELDVVSVCVPTKLHFKIASYILEKKINLLLEKPITSKINDAKTLLKIASNNDVKFLVGHIERYNPAVKKVKEIIKRGDLGRIIAITARRLGGFPTQITDVDIAVDLAIHDIDISNYLLDELPQKVIVNRQRNHLEGRADSVEFFLKYKNASSYIQANWISPVKVRKVNITGTEGYLEMDYITQKVEFYKSNYNKFIRASANYSDYILLFSKPDIINISIDSNEPLKEELLYFINCVINNINLDTSFAYDALKIASIK